MPSDSEVESADSLSGERPKSLHISGRSSPLDFVFLARPVLMPPVWTIALLGSVVPAHESIPAVNWFLLLFQLFCLFGAVYTLNQIYDIESDRKNSKLHFLPHRLISVKAAWWFTIALNASAIGVAVYFGTIYSGLTFAIIGLGVVYSVGDRPWKNRAILGFCANATAHGALVFLLGRIFAGGDLRQGLIDSLPYILAVGAVYLATTVPDCIGDRQSGKKTLAVLIGARQTMVIATVFVATALLISVWGGDWYLAIPSGLVLPLYLAGFMRGERFASRAAIGSVLTLSLAAVTAYPIYLGLLILGFVATRLFYFWRFAMTYPNFGFGGEGGQYHGYRKSS